MPAISVKDESGKLSDVEVNDLIAQWIKQARTQAQEKMDRNALDQWIIEKAREHGLTVTLAG
jgi:hypothetical protein